MISKELFVKSINLIIEEDAKENKLCDVLEELTPFNTVNLFMFEQYENLTIDLLEEGLGIAEDDDIMSWWCWEENYGRDFKVGDIYDSTLNGTIDIRTPEKFYDYLIKYHANKRGKKNENN